MDIAKKDLAAICRAVGVMSPKASEELHDKPLMIKVKVRPAQGEYEASNDVGGYKTDESYRLYPPPQQQKAPALHTAKNLGKNNNNLAAHCGGFLF